MPQLNLFQTTLSHYLTPAILLTSSSLTNQVFKNTFHPNSSYVLEYCTFHSIHSNPIIIDKNEIKLHLSHCSFNRARPILFSTADFLKITNCKFTRNLAENEEYASSIVARNCQIAIESTDFCQNQAKLPYFYTHHVPITLKEVNITKSLQTSPYAILSTKYDVYTYASHSVFSQVSSSIAAFLLESTTSQFMFTIFHQCKGFLFTYLANPLVECTILQSTQIISKGNVTLINCTTDKPFSSFIGVTGDLSQFPEPKDKFATRKNNAVQLRNTSLIKIVYFATLIMGLLVLAAVVVIILVPKKQLTQPLINGEDDTELLSEGKLFAVIDNTDDGLSEQK